MSKQEWLARCAGIFEDYDVNKVTAMEYAEICLESSGLDHDPEAIAFEFMVSMED